MLIALVVFTAIFTVIRHDASAGTSLVSEFAEGLLFNHCMAYLWYLYMMLAVYLLMPLFKAAAVVAIILTLGNAIQVAFNMEDNDPAVNVAEELNKTVDGPSVAKSDSIRIDSMQAMQPIPVLVK